AGELHSGLRFGRIDAIFASGLHEYLTNFLDRLSDLGGEIDRAFFAAPVPVSA
ncbi:MAG: alpha-E domain-containing protein, partial [Burkholderiales bacterium]|nr:alpha-E domain-containing protein [Burkholderiales bacterium]